MKKNNQSFVCYNCGYEVPPAEKTSRNHCPKCFASLHVDVVPGDRASTCGGEMYPVDYTYHPDETVITFRCTRCGHEHRNKQADDDDIARLPALIEEYRSKFGYT